MPRFAAKKAVAGALAEKPSFWTLSPGFNHQKALLRCTDAGPDRPESTVLISLGPRRALPGWVLVGLLTCELG